MASKFYENDSDDDFDTQPQQSSKDNEQSQQESTQPAQKQKKVQKKTQAQKNFDSSDEEEEHRKVLTEKDKRFGEMQAIVKQINNSFKNNNFVQMYDDFENLNKQFAKAQNIVQKEGVPSFYLIICQRIENLVNNLTNADKKKLNTSNNKSYNILKQKIKKNNQSLKDQIEELRSKNPNVFDSDYEPEEEKEVTKKSSKKAQQKQEKQEESDDDLSEDDQADQKKQNKNDDFGGDSDDDFWDQSDDDQGGNQKDDYDEDSDAEYNEQDGEIPIEERRCRWLKHEYLPEWYKKKYNIYDDKNDKSDDEETQKTSSKKQGISKIRDWDKVGEVQNQAVTIDLSPEQILAKIREIVENRTKRQANVKSYHDILSLILDHYQGQALNRLEIILLLLPIRYDFSKMKNPIYMERNEWVASLSNIQEILVTLKTLKESSLNKIRTFNKDGEEFHQINLVYSILISQAETLDNELNKAMKQLNEGTFDQVQRMADMKELLKFFKDLQQYFEDLQDNQKATKIAFLRLENLYNIHDSLLSKLRALAKQNGIGNKGYYYEETDSKQLIHKLATMVYRFSDNTSRLKAILYQVYHLSIHNHYYQAKDYLLMSQVQQQISTNDITIQALYNRVLVQIGLCAFRLGLVQECQQTLQEICQTGKLKELISQGLSKNVGALEKEEKRKLLPYQMHINTEVVDIVYYIVSMLLEIPNFAQQDPSEINKKIISKHFRNLLAFYERQHFIGPSESYKDFIYAASNELLKGNWETCYQNLLNINNFWNQIYNEEQVKDIIKQKVQEYALRCYLLNFKNCLECISFQHLQQRFQLEERVVVQIISKMIHQREISGNIDEKCIIIEAQETSKLQKLSMTLAEKLQNLVLNNEKILDGKFGNYGFQDKQSQQTGDDATTFKKKVYKKKGVFVKAHNGKQTQNKYKQYKPKKQN